MLLNKTRMPARIASAIITLLVALATITGCEIKTTTTDIIIIEDVTVIVVDNEVQ